MICKKRILKSLKLRISIRQGGEVEAQIYPFLIPAMEGGQHSVPHPDRFNPRKERRYSLNRRMCGPRSDLDGSGITSLTEFRILDHPANSQSLYQLLYSGLQRMNKSFLRSSFHILYFWIQICRGYISSKVY